MPDTVPGTFPHALPSVWLKTQALTSLDLVGDLVLALLALGRNDPNSLRYSNIIIIIMRGNIYIVFSMCQVLVQALTTIPRVGITVIIPAIKMMTVRCRKVEGLAQGHTANM